MDTGTLQTVLALIAGKHQTLGNIVRVIFNQCLLDQQIDVVGRQLQLAALLNLTSQDFTDTFSYRGDKLLIDVGKNVFFLARQQQIRERSTNRVGNLGQIELAFNAFCFNFYFGTLEAGLADNSAPVKAGLLILRCGCIV